MSLYGMYILLYFLKTMHANILMFDIVILNVHTNINSIFIVYLSFIEATILESSEDLYKNVYH